MTMQTDRFNESGIRRLVQQALEEDIGGGDLTGTATVPEHDVSSGELLCNEPGIVAGLQVAAWVFQSCDPAISFEPQRTDGSAIQRGDILALVDGKTRAILKGERTALNFLQRMSGIATLTRRFVEAVSGTRATITDTRKTAPGLRALDKLAVRLGGGKNHRFGLDDMVLIKDNHIIAAGGITEAVRRCREYLSAGKIEAAIEVETNNLEEVREALRCPGVKRIMLDNFERSAMREAVKVIDRRVGVEASGGITLETVREVAETGVDFISVGTLTHSARALDISFDLQQTSRRGTHR